MLRSLRAGFRLALGARFDPGAFRVGADGIAFLIALWGIVAIVCGHLLTEPPRVFSIGGAAGQSFGIVLALGFAWLVARESERPERLGAVAAALLAAAPPLWAAYTALQLGLGAWIGTTPDGVAWLVWGVFALWFFAVWFRAARGPGGLDALRAVALAGLLAVVSSGLDFAYEAPRYWYTVPPELPEEVAEEAPPAFDAEALLHAQHALLDEVRRSLAPERPGVVDLYAVAFGADATQGVFRSEVELVRELFDRRFDTEGRSVVLVNHEETVEAHPLASATNLAVVLEAVGAVLNPDEDVLFLYLTGHGSRDHELRVHFPPLPLNPIDPPRLGGLLEASGIPARVVVVSACYSGGFVDALADPYTLVASAAAPDRRSFGCSNDAELTDFGEALFAEALERTHSFEHAFEDAARRVAEREEAEGKEPSQPRYAGGEAIRPRLARIEQRATRLAAGR